METTTVAGRYCVDRKVEADMVDDKTSSNFTQLHSYNYEKHQSPFDIPLPETCSTDKNDEKIQSHRTKLSQWTSGLFTDQQLTKRDIDNVANTNEDKKLQRLIRSPPLLNSRHSAFPSVMDSNQDSTQNSPLTNNLPNVSLASCVPDGAAISAFSNPRTSEVFSNPRAKNFMPKITIDKQKRESERTVRGLNQPNKAFKRGTNLVIPCKLIIWHESLKLKFQIYILCVCAKVSRKFCLFCVLLIPANL